MIERNIGNVERLLRFTFGVGLIVLFIEPASRHGCGMVLSARWR